MCGSTCEIVPGVLTFCGDGVLNGANGQLEACDDGNDQPGDGCSAICEVEEGFNCEGLPSQCTSICGDELLASDEECDDGNLIIEACDYGLTECFVCNDICDLVLGATSVCGDAQVNGDDETCDEGQETETCDQDCTLAECGDGTLNPTSGEACDDEGESEECTADCALSECGDGVLNLTAGEICDEGGDTATCDADCTPAECGDGTSNASADEACDDETESATCNADCTLAECGDSVLNQTSGEVCDEGGDTPTCDADCTLAECGDGTLNANANESCDDGAESATCNDDCTLAECGDSVHNQTSGEVCDEGGNTASCDADCTLAECGDGTLNENANEACDDGDEIDDNACDNSCQLPVCGDGVTEGDEECDDGDEIETDACLSTCVAARCGDLVVQTNIEECDDGDDVDDNECTNQCRLPVCGDAIINGIEECDDGGELGEGEAFSLDCPYGGGPCDVCVSGCTLQQGVETFCGDGIVQVDDGEDCDSTRGCSETCSLPCSPNCPPVDWALISAATFQMGGNAFPASTPQHSVTIGYDYYISKKEVIVSDYQLCVEADYCELPGSGGDCNWGSGDEPINCVTWAQMKTYATWLGADLPTEAEWELAATGTSPKYFVWGNTIPTQCIRAVFLNATTSFTGCGLTFDLTTKPPCSINSGFNSPEDVCDLNGNLAEWTLDAYSPNHNTSPTDGSPYCPVEDCLGGGDRVTKGGSFESNFEVMVNFNRIPQDASSAFTTVGGRLVRLFP